MKVNKNKTKCMPFINSNTRDFMPQLSLKEGVCLEVIYELKRVGLVITSDNMWTAHIDYTVTIKAHFVVTNISLLSQLPTFCFERNCRQMKCISS